MDLLRLKNAYALDVGEFVGGSLGWDLDWRARVIVDDG